MRRPAILSLALICILYTGLCSVAEGSGYYGDPTYVRRPGCDAWVASIDQPENCLRVRSGPGTWFQIIGCARFGETLTLSGLWTQNNWAEVVAPVRGWVLGTQLRLNSTYAVVAPSVTDVDRFLAPAACVGSFFPRRIHSSFWWPRPALRPWWRHHRVGPVWRGHGGHGSRVWVGPRGGRSGIAVGRHIGHRGGVWAGPRGGGRHFSAGRFGGGSAGRVGGHRGRFR